ncbi:MAG: serine/threonine-protein phosphatase [Dechloromonas sp.]|jgi:serine/threonine protein phosphatase PrpC|nr:serine/threonine-protein phosphatase [Dechloromonas sp.]MBN8462120.1 serine/threonine-protein phosphatase [Dechloromonas sp.]
MLITVDACAAQHQGDRKEQQDRLAILPHVQQRGVALAVVADGMGGHAGGALAAEQVVHTVKTSFECFSPTVEMPRILLENSLLEAHLMIKASRFMNEKDPHSTAVMLLLQPGRATWAHCGDSRLYRFRDGEPIFRSVDHSYVQHLIATGRLAPEEALSHPNRNVLVTSLGGKEDPRFDFGEARDLTGGDSFVICSDGLWAYFDDAEMGRIVAENSARRASQILVDAARARAAGGGDNLSLVIIKLNEARPAVAPPINGRRR